MITKIEAFKANNGTLHESEEAAIEENNMEKEVNEKLAIKEILEGCDCILMQDGSAIFVNWLYNHNIRVVETPDKLSNVIKEAVDELDSLPWGYDDMDCIPDDVKDVAAKLTKAVS